MNMFLVFLYGFASATAAPATTAATAHITPEQFHHHHDSERNRRVSRRLPMVQINDPLLADYNTWCPTGSPIFNDSPVSAGSHTDLPGPHSPNDIKLLLLPVEVGQGSFPTGHVSVLRNILSSLSSFMEKNVLLGRSTFNVAGSDVALTYDGSSYLSDLMGQDGKINHVGILAMFHAAITSYHESRNGGNGGNGGDICSFRSIAMVVYGDTQYPGGSLPIEGFHSQYGTVIPWATTWDVDFVEYHLGGRLLAHEEGHGFGMAHVQVCHLSGTSDPLGYGFRATNDGEKDGTTMSEVCVTYGSKHSVMGGGNDRVGGGVSPCLLLQYGSVTDGQVSTLGGGGNNCNAVKTNSGLCITSGGTGTLAPYDSMLSRTASKVVMVVLFRLGKPAYLFSKTRTMMDIGMMGQETFNCQTTFDSTDGFRSLKEYVQKANGCFVEDNDGQSVGKRQDVLVIGYNEKKDGLLLNMWKGTKRDQVMASRASTDWSVLQDIAFVDAIEVNAALGMHSSSSAADADDDAEDGVFVTLGTTLSSCWIGNDLTNNVHVTYKSSSLCAHIASETCADVVVERNDPRTFDYASIGVGYCANKVNLPEGSYPPVLGSEDPLCVANDRKKECMFRCLQAYPRTTAFYVRKNDEACTCAKPLWDGGDGCETPTISSGWPDGYHAYRISMDVGTLPTVPSSSSSVDVIVGEWSTVVSSSGGGGNNVHGVSLKSVSTSTFFDVGGGRMGGDNGALRLKHPGMFIAHITTSDTKGRVSHADVLLRSTASSSAVLEERTSELHAITDAGFSTTTTTTALGFTASVSFPSPFAPPVSGTVLSLLRWNGLSVRLICNTKICYFWIGTTGDSHLEIWPTTEQPTVPLLASPSSAQYWTTRATPASLAGRKVHVAFTTTNDVARVYLDGSLYSEFDWPSSSRSTHPAIDAALHGPSPVIESSYFGYPIEMSVTGATYYNFWLTKEAVALSRGKNIVLFTGAIVCNEQVEGIGGISATIESGNNWKDGEKVISSGSDKFSYLCSDLQDYEGYHRYVSDESTGIKTTCDAAMIHFTAVDAPLESFGKTRGTTCESEEAQYIQWLTDQGCCGETRTGCCGEAGAPTCGGSSTKTLGAETGAETGAESGATQRRSLGGAVAAITLFALLQ